MFIVIVFINFIFFVLYQDGARIDARWDNGVASCVSALLGKPLEPLKLGKIQDRYYSFIYLNLEAILKCHLTMSIV